MMFPSRIKLEQPIAPSYVCKRFQVILERAGCKRVRFHDLRHTFNTYTHITDEMRWKVALNITQGIGKALVQTAPEHKSENYTWTAPRRRSGTMMESGRIQVTSSCRNESML